MSRLENKVAIITGGSGGIGQAAAATFIREGAKVMLVDLDEAALKQTAESLQSNLVDYCVADVSQSGDTQRYINATVDSFGRLDILVANAGIEGAVSPITEYDENTFDKVMSVNVKGVWLGIKYAFPIMQNNGGGSIVITSSTMGVKGAPGLSAYNASKHAVIGIMRSAALEGAAANIRVNTVNPSQVETQMMRRLEVGINPGDASAIHDRLAAAIPLQRYAEPQDIANVMLFLASDESAFITGGIYMADGGNTT